MKKKLKIAGLLLLFLLITGVTGIFIFRTFLLKNVLERVQNKLKEKYSCEFNYKNAGFEGLKTVVLNDISLIPENGDTLIRISSLRASIKLFSLLVYKVRVENLSAEDSYFNLRKTENGDNFSFLFKRKANADTSSEQNLGKSIRKKLETLIDNVPDELYIKNASFNYQSYSNRLNFSIPEFRLSEHIFKGTLFESTDSSKIQNITLNGIFKDQHVFQIKCFSKGERIYVPYINKKYNASINFDTLEFSLNNEKYSSPTLTLEGIVKAKNLIVNHPKLATNDIKLDSCSWSYFLNINEHKIELDSSSEVYVNSIKINPYLVLEPKKSIDLKAKIEAVEANTFFNSLPDGIFNTLKGIKARGYLTYNLNFSYDKNKPDNLQFSSNLRGDNFKIEKFGAEYIPKINSSFSYTAFEKGIPVKTFVVGPENPDFISLTQISPYLRDAVLTSEDGSFFYHRGFNEEAFRKSIIDNIKKGKFARGGSTISMQLVKNVYLNRNKNIARKIEEALIVWLIENNRLSSKERMYEVYLNIIEWGPHIYGIKEAADFYFKKEPGQLDLSESIFLASIVPKPKAFKYSFDEQGNLKPFLQPYYRIMTDHMLKKGYITLDEVGNIYLSDVQLKGKAKYLVTPAAEIPEDLFEDEN